MNTDTQTDIVTLITLKNNNTKSCNELIECYELEKAASYALHKKELEVRAEILQDLECNKNSAAKNESIVKQRTMQERINLDLREFNRRMAVIKQKRDEEELNVYKKQMNIH